MNYLILEDEPLAAEKLVNSIADLRPDWKHLATLPGIEQARRAIANFSPQLIFVDIHLADGLSFEIFKEQFREYPLIFTTAYDQYALRAFELNSIDYLLKPVSRNDLERALLKLENRSAPSAIHWEKLMKDMQPTYKERFVVSTGERIKTVASGQIAFFYARGKHCFLTGKDGREYLIDKSLQQLMEVLDPGKFFQVNRQFIVALEGIKEMIPWSKSRLKIVMEPPAPEEVIVSVERSPQFKSWLAGEN